MPLIYSFVSRGNTVLADFTSYTGNFSTVALQVGRAGPWRAVGCLTGAGRPRGPAQRAAAAAAAALTGPPCAAALRVALVCRRLRKAHRGPTPSSHTPAMATVRAAAELRGPAAWAFSSHAAN